MPYFAFWKMFVSAKVSFKNRNYFKSFVLNAVNNFKVENTGFEIKQFNPAKEAILEIGTGLKGKPVLILTYNYQGNKIYASESSNTFTLFEEEGDNFIFRKCFSWKEVKFPQTCLY